tara:strand:+ start:420 stop:530 length:111 start_codon:yes stop_codon:yes gene_type:complete
MEEANINTLILILVIFSGIAGLYITLGKGPEERNKN